MKYRFVEYGDIILTDNGLYALSYSDTGVVMAYKNYPTSYSSNIPEHITHIIDSMLQSELIRELLNLNEFYYKYYEWDKHAA